MCEQCKPTRELASEIQDVYNKYVDRLRDAGLCGEDSTEESAKYLFEEAKDVIKELLSFSDSIEKDEIYIADFSTITKRWNLSSEEFMNTKKYSGIFLTVNAINNALFAIESSGGDPKTVAAYMMAGIMNLKFILDEHNIVL